MPARTRPSPLSLRFVRYARLHNQRLSSTTCTNPAAVVSGLGAVQAQDYPGAKWALALRMRQATDLAIERAFAAGEILRTHVMRPTWHFVAPADIRWMLALTAPRVRATMATYDRRLGLHAGLIKRSNRTIAAALAGGAQLTRQELKEVLRKAGVAADGVQRLAHLMMHAELDGVICSGARRGKQFTYALLAERVPDAPMLPREKAVAELARRYFTSHGPAQLQDFVWWSGLRAADARAGLEMAAPDLADDVIDGKRYWFSSAMRAISRPPRTAYLLPLYDEYLIAYKDRRAAIQPETSKPVANHDPFSAPIVIDGRVVGAWKPTSSRDGVAIALHLPGSTTQSDVRLIVDAARRFGRFLGMNVAVGPGK
jgi:Winged helix DNA-binding domain